MSRKILETNNYHKFALAPFNRELGNIKRLEASMRQCGFWDDKPILVKRENGKLLIVEGQHRFEVARRLGLPVKYLETKREVNIPEDERSKRPWSLKDYLYSYCQMGKEPYLRVREYFEQTGINLVACISLLAGESAGSNNQVSKFKSGTYLLGNPAHSRVVALIIGQCRESGFPAWNNHLFVQAVSKIAWAEGFAAEVMKEKIKTHVQFMKKQGTKQEYLEMLESIYNRQSHTRIPLAFLAEEAARKRSAIKYL